MGHGASSQVSFWGGRRLFEAQTLRSNKEAPGGTHQGSPRRIAGHLSSLQDGEAGGFPGGNKAAHLLKQLNGITCKDGRASSRGRKRL